MKSLKPLAQIVVPSPKPDETYRIDLLGKRFAFAGLKRLLGAADFDKAGDRGAGLAAPDEVTREAARMILSGLTLRHIYDRPLTDDAGKGNGKVDSVMRVNYDVDVGQFEKISAWTVGELKDFLLKSPGDAIQPIGRALTGVLGAAVAKLMDTHELVYIAQKISCPSKARTTLGLPGTLSSRLQPNHPSDDLRGISLLTYYGLSQGGGDALLGVNPAIDTVENISAILGILDKIRKRVQVPTQICVLAHIKTQLACLERGVPVEILFQSLAGTEKTLLTEFDVSVDLLDQGYEAMAERGPLRDVAENTMYFETGQGSEFTYGKHNGMDMATAEALCYGLARRYRPFMVNNVTGFIGPETHLDNFEMIISNLQDHFMGKLLGVPMGMAPCYTMHSKTTLEGQQMATQLLTAAGANYYMDVCLNTDRMLAYFDTSGHDNQTLREVYGKTVTPEYLQWALGRGIFKKEAGGKVVRGPQWGNPRAFCESDAEYQELLQATPCIYEVEHAGPKPSNKVSRLVKSNQAIGRNAVHSELDFKLLKKISSFRRLVTEAKDRDSHLNSPSLGAELAKSSAKTLKAERKQVQVVLSDGLSAEAVNHNIRELFPVLMDGLKSKRLKCGKPILVPYGRVKIAEDIASRLKADLTVLLIGERPGGDALSAQSLSAYFAYQLTDGKVQKKAAEFSGHPKIRFEYTVLSNIYSGGLPPLEAGSVIVEKISEILKYQAAGNRLESLLKGGRGE